VASSKIGRRDDGRGQNEREVSGDQVTSDSLVESAPAAEPHGERRQPTNRATVVLVGDGGWDRP
jgi:hypothetical protein